MNLSTLLVANRGEIAIRVIRAAQKIGLRTVAVYSDADREAPHVRAADTAVRIGPTPATESYLSIEAILEAARKTGADAVHPGYGFLSERAAFARAVAEAGLTFVGPTADVMEQMGRKDVAREVAVAAGVPVVPAAELSGGGGAIAASAPDKSVGYPLLVKAAAGGGGKGMRIVRDPADFVEAVASARREARSAFGDDTILVERYVEHGRHVEVQVLADQHGNVVHLFERDCSTQRRHQKVIEEAPAPTISAAVRKVLTDSSVALAKQVGYTNAGTVEFLVSGEEVFFLEMNTRLQVEHPVTELVVSTGTGEPFDLVQLQLLVAAGEALPFAQDDVTLTGHAIEARVYAEDAFNGFLPQAGVAESVRWSPRARNDVALESGQEVSTSYDPMLGKVIVHGSTREAARRALVTALDDTAILGLTTNLGFLRGLAASDAFRDCEIDTAWLDTHPDAIRPEGAQTAVVLAAWALASARHGDPTHPFGTADGWRLSGPAALTTVELVVDGEQALFKVDPAGSVIGRGHTWRVHPIASDAGVLRLEVDDLVHEAAVRITPHRVDVAHVGNTFSFERPDAFAPGAGLATSDGTVVAPMPGTVLSVAAAVGDMVQEGQVLGVMEAMKMELALKAPVAGTVTSVGAGTGDQVALGATLFVVDAEEGSDHA
jgi:acetyl-CoA/propionyl-CoA carboxylase biotin carboxyl carrier protein